MFVLFVFIVLTISPFFYSFYVPRFWPTPSASVYLSIRANVYGQSSFLTITAVDMLKMKHGKDLHFIQSVELFSCILDESSMLLWSLTMKQQKQHDVGSEGKWGSSSIFWGIFKISWNYNSLWLFMYNTVKCSSKNERLIGHFEKA